MGIPSKKFNSPCYNNVHGVGIPWLLRWWLLLAVAGCCWLLLAVAGCCWLLLVVAGCCWLLLVVAVLLAVAGCCWLVVVLLVGTGSGTRLGLEPLARRAAPLHCPSVLTKCSQF